MEQSILKDIKKLIGPSIAYNVFNTDIVININAAFFTLYQLGVGPQDKAFTIIDSDAVWKDFCEDETVIAAVKQYVYLKVRLIFDPPTSTNVHQAYQDQVNELEWRLRELAAGMFDVEEEDDDSCCGCPDTDPTPDNPDGDDGDGSDDEPGETPAPPVGEYILPIATSDRLGGVMIGNNVNVDEEGRISVDDIVLSDDDLSTREEVQDMINRVFGED